LVTTAAWLLAAPAADASLRRSADPEPVSDAEDVAAPAVPRAAERGVVFVNFDGTRLSFGSDDARTDTTILQELAGDFPAYGGTSERAAVLQAVKADFAAYDVVVVDSRPTSGNYTMAMVGPVDAGMVLGIAPLDCRDRLPNNVVFAFHGPNDGYTAPAQARTISQEVAHSFGLEHVDRPGDIMYPVSAGGDPAFLDECIAVVANPMIECGDQHEDHCPAGQQNSHREVLQRFGPSTPVDPAEVLLEISEPGDGDEIGAATPFTITARSIDGRSYANVVLFVNESNVGGRAAPPFSWDVPGLDAGVYELYVIGVEASGAMSRSDTIELFVGVDNPERDEGGCRVAPRDASHTPWLALVIVCAWRRRASRVAPRKPRACPRDRDARPLTG
jgi:hypothetical protein